MPPPAGYSGTPTAKKLGMNPGDRVALIGCDATARELLGDACDELEIRTDLRARSHAVVVLFCPDMRTLERTFDRARARLTPSGGLWVAWPKKDSGMATDLTREPVRDHGLACGLVDNKVCAIDETWSGLRFVIRLEDRPGAR